MTTPTPAEVPDGADREAMRSGEYAPVGNELLWQQDDVAPSHPEDFAYELGWVALGETLGDDDDGCEAARAMGEAIVGCEEMRAIKAVLHHLAARQAMEVQAPTADVLRLLGLPDVAVEWVLS